MKWKQAYKDTSIMTTHGLRKDLFNSTSNFTPQNDGYSPKEGANLSGETNGEFFFLSLE